MLWGLNLAVDPLPVAAAPAFACGALAALAPRRPSRRGVIAASLAGAMIGIAAHRHWHLVGKSPPPPEGLLEHLLVEGFIGWFGALAALTALALLRLGLERSGADDPSQR